MPWYLPNLRITDEIKKRVCIYLLQHYLGQYLEEKLSSDQLTLDLYNGTGTIKNVSLDMQKINEAGQKHNWPLELVSGCVEQISFSIPWSSILKDPSFIELNGIKIIAQPKQRNETATSMFESMWSSMSSSMQMAQECTRQDGSTQENLPSTEGIEIVAQAIDSILTRVKVKFTNLSIEMEHIPKDSINGVGLTVNIANMEYLDESGDDPPTGESVDNEQDKAFIVSAFTTKNLSLEGVKLSTVEFLVKNREEFFDGCKNRDTDSPEKNESDNSSRGDESADDFKSGPERHVIHCGQISGKQGIRIRIKQSEDVPGPKVSIEGNFGALYLLLSPRQIFLLSELLEGLFNPETENFSNVSGSFPRCMEKPMTELDFQRVENDLQMRMQNLFGAQGLQGAGGWSAAGLDDLDPDENFVSMRGVSSSGTMGESGLSTASSSMDSSLTSSVTSSVSETPSQRSRRKIHSLDADPTAEISHFQLRFASLGLFLLHEDLLSLTTIDGCQFLAPASVKQMQSTAALFFKQTSAVVLAGYGARNFDGCRDAFETACKYSHLRLLAAPIQVECRETTTSTALAVAAELTAAKLEVLECLAKLDKSMDYVRVLNFEDAKSQAQPCFHLEIKHTEKTVKTGIGGRLYVPKTDVRFKLDACILEVDITIIDRISALLNFYPICIIKKAQHVWGHVQPLSKIGMPTSESELDLKLTSPMLTLKLRFPVLDFRPSTDLNKTPWWERNVRSSFMTIELANLSANTLVVSKNISQKYELQSNSINAFYYENESAVPLHFATSVPDERLPRALYNNMNSPRICLNVYPVSNEKVDLGNEPELEMTMSFCGTILPQPNTGPFSSKTCIHQSDTPHSKAQNENDEMVIPGDKEEMKNFIDNATQSVRFHLEICLPTVIVDLISKHMYEVIYNHITSDLLLWEPSAKFSKSQTLEQNFASIDLQAPEKYTFCNKSSTIYESDSSDEFDLETSGDLFYSAYDSRKKPNKNMKQISKVKSQSFFILDLHIGQGVLKMNPPVRDLATNVIPEQVGEFLVVVERLHVFSVSAFNGDDNLGYVCVQSKAAQLHHCDMQATPSQSTPISQIGRDVGQHLHPTIYKSEIGIMANSKEASNREMFSVAVKIQGAHETHHVKTVRVALGINRATLRHRMCAEPNSWITQLIDFFNVHDYAIPGYRAREVLTELHLHLWDSAIDYRPFNLPLRSCLTLGSFSMSSHLVASANTSTLRFLAEECALFISDRHPPKNGKPSSVAVDLKRDFVCVMNLGLFELSLRLSDKLNGNSPHIDLRASNNVLYIRTCADSGRALMQLLTYLASDGDLVSTHDDPAFSVSASPRHSTTDEELISVESESISNLSKSQQNKVNTLIDDAMTESIYVQREPVKVIQPGAKIFFFPDEGQLLEDALKPLPQVTTDLGNVTFLSNRSSDTDEEYCFIDNDAGLGILPKNGLPEINWLAEEPTRTANGHFALPLGKTDNLKAPKHFPMPVARYTVCDMSLVWQMYGGEDFTSPEQKDKKTVNFSDEHQQLPDAIAYTNKNTGHIIFHNYEKAKKKDAVHWTIRGGANRNRNVLIELQLNKVRYLTEVYPENATQVSRQVLLISEFEVRDRLKSSPINKFLYQYTSEARPKKTHAHMVSVKALHIRPDLKIKAEECSLRLSLLPLRLNIDQDTLLFLIDFFGELAGSKAHTIPLSKQNTPTHHPPVMTIASNEPVDVDEAQKIIDENLLLILDDVKDKVTSKTEEVSAVQTTKSIENSAPVYFRKLLFSPAVPIRLDYHGKHVNMKHGPLAGLLMGLGQLNSSEFTLKRIANDHGILGFDKLLQYCLQEWINDIKKNQFHKVLGGVGPIHSLVQFFQGIKDLFWLPIEQYQKDGRIVRGLQRGAHSFTTSTAMAALELTTRIIHLIQVTAETAYDMMSPGPSVRRPIKAKGRRKRYNQPQDIRDGVASALNVFKEGFEETAETIVRVAAKEHEQKGYSGAVGGVLRQIPPSMLQPIIMATQATNNVLGGVQSQLLPDAKREANEKWKNVEG